MLEEGVVVQQGRRGWVMLGIKIQGALEDFDSYTISRNVQVGHSVFSLNLFWIYFRMQKM